MSTLLPWIPGFILLLAFWSFGLLVFLVGLMLKRKEKKSRHRRHLRLSITAEAGETFTVVQRGNMASSISVSMVDAQSFVATVQEVDKNGNVVPFDSAPVWTIDNASVASLAPSADGSSCTFTATAAGTATGTATVTGGPNSPLTATVAITVTALPGVGLEITATTPA